MSSTPFSNITNQSGPNHAEHTENENLSHLFGGFRSAADYSASIPFPSSPPPPLSYRPEPAGGLAAFSAAADSFPLPSSWAPLPPGHQFLFSPIPRQFLFEFDPTTILPHLSSFESHDDWNTSHDHDHMQAAQRPGLQLGHPLPFHDAHIHTQTREDLRSPAQDESSLDALAKASTRVVTAEEVDRPMASLSSPVYRYPSPALPYSAVPNSWHKRKNSSSDRLALSERPVLTSPPAGGVAGGRTEANKENGEGTQGFVKVKAKRTRTNRVQPSSGANFSNIVCEECGKTFQKPASLIQHKLTHNGERPFGCEYEGCTKRFTTSSNVKRHWKTHF